MRMTNLTLLTFLTMPKNYYEQAEDCIYCGDQLDIGSLDRGRKVHKYPNCGQRNNFFKSKLERAKKSKNQCISKFAKKWEKILKEGKLGYTPRQVDVMLTTVMRAKMFPMVPRKQVNVYEAIPA